MIRASGIEPCPTLGPVMHDERAVGVGSSEYHRTRTDSVRAHAEYTIHTSTIDALAACNPLIKHKWSRA
jgi:hypothetical protein